MLARRPSQAWGNVGSCHSTKNHQPTLAEAGQPCTLQRSWGFQLRAPGQPWYANLGFVPTEPASTCPGESKSRGRWERFSFPTSFQLQPAPASSNQPQPAPACSSQLQPAPGTFEVLGQEAWPVQVCGCLFVCLELLCFSVNLSNSGPFLVVRKHRLWKPMKSSSNPGHALRL